MILKQYDIKIGGIKKPVLSGFTVKEQKLFLYQIKIILILLNNLSVIKINSNIESGRLTECMKYVTLLTATLIHFVTTIYHQYSFVTISIKP